MLDVLVLGKGPAALAAAAALAGRGLRAGVLGPPGPPRWTAQYGVWADELEAAGLAEAAGVRWDTAAVGLGGERTRLLDRAYVRVDRDRLARVLLARCEAGGVRWLDGEAEAAEHRPAGSRVRLRGGGGVEARVVVDASGHRPALVERGARPAQGFQTAWGAVVPGPVPGVEPGRATLMDWDDAGLPPSPVPTFLYALPFPDGSVFVEETVLVGRPAVPPEALEARLRARLALRGVEVPAGGERELCRIPMGGALPRPQRVVGFGGAAGMVHPATGYLLARVLADAPVLTGALAEALGRPGATPEDAARAGWDALWPADRRRRHALFRFGMEALLRLDAPDTRAFFAAFFELPEADWRGYLGDRLPTAELAAVMARFFARVPRRVRGRLASAALGADGVRLARSLAGAGT
ncbi:MAG: lycopene cyclase family protein [Gemmatimonadota bacterium]